MERDSLDDPRSTPSKRTYLCHQYEMHPNWCDATKNTNVVHKLWYRNKNEFYEVFFRGVYIGEIAPKLVPSTGENNFTLNGHMNSKNKSPMLIHKVLYTVLKLVYGVLRVQLQVIQVRLFQKDSATTNTAKIPCLLRKMFLVTE